ncbi:MAG: hypothetical protein GQ528_05030, partial [Woeseiaceae bacterium]|nr:hypothetical protein [Woeseiaceae bacterium]
MSKNLVIVESPAKAKTISKYLGKDFDVMASYGHVRDLVPKEGAVNTADGFTMKYQIIERNEKHVNAIIRALKKAEALYLATDPDREGEAISWHLVELLKEKNALNDKPVHRVVFHEITKTAIKEAIEHPRDISGDLVSAQQARRALDYLVGFNTQWTMRVAQRLYEGIELADEGNVGLISYMRTDSVTLASVAVDEIRNVIADRYGPENVPESPRQFKTTAKNAQEAHEAIRPTSAARTPDSLKGKLDKDQLKLYTLIWQRTMACQMVPAVFDT